VGVHDGGDVGAGGMDREMDGQVGGRTETAPGDRVALWVIEPDDDEILGLQLILANAGRGDQQPIRVEPDGEVALACRDEGLARPACCRRGPRRPSRGGRRSRTSRSPEPSSVCWRDEPRRAALGAGARRLAIERYSWDDIGRRLVEIYEQAIAS